MSRGRVSKGLIVRKVYVLPHSQAKLDTGLMQDMILASVAIQPEACHFKNLHISISLVPVQGKVRCQLESDFIVTENSHGAPYLKY